MVADGGDNAVDIGVAECVVHGKADDAVSHAVGNRKVVGTGTVETTVGAELADEGVEISAAIDALLPHAEIELVTRLTIFLLMNEDGKIAVVVAHTGKVIPKIYAGDITKGFTVADGYLVARLDGCVNLTEVEQTIGGTHLIHLGIDTRSDDLCLTCEAEILQVVNAAFGLLVVHDHGTALDGIIDLGGVEGKCRHVASVEQRYTVLFDTESVGGIVNNAETVFVSDVLDGLGVAWLTIDMYGHDGSSARGDGGFNLVGVEAAGGPVDVDEYGFDAVPPQCVSSGNKTIWRCDNLAADMEGLKGGDERQGAVGEETHIGHLEVFGEGLFQLFVERAVIGNPFRSPDVFEHRLEFVEVG